MRFAAAIGASLYGAPIARWLRALLRLLDQGVVFAADRAQSTVPPAVIMDWEDCMIGCIFAIKAYEIAEKLQRVRRSFGMLLIEKSFASQFSGAAQVSFDPAGIICTFDVPLAAIQMRGSS